MDHRSPYPEAASLELLIGQVSEPITTTSHKPGFEGQQVQVRLVQEGAGLAGLTDAADSREWSGIVNHFIVSSRLATYLAQLVAEKGIGVDVQTVLNSHLVSHTGRRPWDEAGWYPDAVPAQSIRNRPNELLGMEMLQQAKIRPEIQQVVAGLAFEGNDEIYRGWAYRLAEYADQRTSQHIEPLAVRMGDFLTRNFFTTPDLNEDRRRQILETVDRMVHSARSLQVRSYDSAEQSAFNAAADEAFAAVRALGANENSARLPLRQYIELILENASIEGDLIRLGIDVDSLNDENPPAPRWERYLRRLYIQDAESEIMAKLTELTAGIETAGDNKDALAKISQQIDREFPPTTWWGKLAREIFAIQKGQVYVPREGRSTGIERAIAFFKTFEPHKVQSLEQLVAMIREARPHTSLKIDFTNLKTTSHLTIDEIVQQVLQSTERLLHAKPYGNNDHIRIVWITDTEEEPASAERKT